MLRLVLVCLALVSTASAEANSTSPNTRIFGLGNIVNSALGVLGGALQPGYQQNQHHQQGGFQQGVHQQGGFQQGVHQQGVHQQGGFQQGGFPQGGFQQGGHQQGGFQQGGFQGAGLQQGGFLGGLGGVQQGGFQVQGGYNPGFPGVGITGGINQQFPGVGITGGINQQFPGASINIAAAPATCRRWCRTPQGQAQCCESANEPLQQAALKPGQCPAVRPSCPPTRVGGQPPRQCSSDGGCAGYDKCCFDVCLQHTVCKPPIGLGRR